MKKKFTLDDMKEAFEAGERRTMWEETSVRGIGYQPTFEEFIQDYYGAKA